MLQSGYDSDHFDLLPFIAILMCVLGCLLLVTMSVAALSIGPAVGEGWIPSGDSMLSNKTPVLVEWDGTTATLHRESRKLRAKWSAPPPRLVTLLGGNSYQMITLTEEKDFHPELRALLQDLSKNKSTQYALFAVRPSGFQNFFQFADEFRRREIDIGYEPIPQDKPVRLLTRRGQQ